LPHDDTLSPFELLGLGIFFGPSEAARGAELDRQLQERANAEVQRKQGFDQIEALNDLNSDMRRQAAQAASELAKTGVEFNAAALGGGFVRPGAGGGRFQAARKAESAAQEGFTSFRALKRYLGSAGEGNVWHHIVEQRPSNIARFGAEAIHNTGNVIPVTAEVNQKLANLYSSIRKGITGSDTLTVRQWLNSKSFAEQRAFGLQALENVMNGQWP
jgi:hypothetical protein